MANRRSVARVVLSAALLAVGASASLAVLPGCGGGSHPAAASRKVVAAQWQDVFDGTPDFYAVVRPQAIKRDAVYGSFFKTLLRLAQARTEMTGVTPLEALEGCDELIVGVRRPSPSEGPVGDDAAIVLRGVPANLDPAKMTDRAGHPVFRLVDEHSKTPEYEFTGALDGERGARRGGISGSMFVLAERTWVVAIGAAQTRARQAFASPFGRPAPKVAAEALAVVRLDANAFVRGRALERSPAFGPLVRKLSNVTLALEPGKNGAVVALQYENEDASAWAEMHTKRLLEEIVAADAQPAPPSSSPRRRQPGSFAWLKDARVDHDGNTVKVRLAVPPRLLDELPNVAPSDLSL